MKAIVYSKNIPRFLMVKALSRWWPGVATGGLGCIQLEDIPEPKLPGDDWVKIRPRLSGICGSDLATVYAKGSPYFSPLTSCPFVLGHELVGQVTEVGSKVTSVRVSDRVIVEPALGCLVRGIDPPCPRCAEGNYANCENVTQGRIAEGIQTGYCRDTGGAWSEALVAHQSQVHKVPAEMPDEIAVLVEPYACALHAALKVDVPPDATILLIGCGTMGLLVLVALRNLGAPNRIIASAWTPRQRELAESLGATQVLTRRGRELYSEIMRLTEVGLSCREGTEHEGRFRQKRPTGLYQPEIGDPYLLSGLEITLDCVGSSRSLQDALRLTRSRGKVILVGMPGIPKGIDWTPIWHKELAVSGSYAYGAETHRGAKIRTFELALRHLAEHGEKVYPLIGRKYRLEEYSEALLNALRGTGPIKSVFEIP